MGKGFTSQSGLIDRNVDSLGETAISGNDVSDFEGDHVSGNQIRRLDFSPSPRTLHLGLGSKGIHESLDGVSSVPFFVKSNSRVGQQEQHDTNEILPVGRASSTVRESDGNKGGSFHDPRERVPHETEELSPVSRESDS